MSKLTDRERLIAEQAIETLRALDRAADNAPHGQGLACMEDCIHDKGLGLLRTIMTSTASARPEAQKRGLHPALSLWRASEIQSVPIAANPDHGRSHRLRSASLLLPVLCRRHHPTGCLGGNGRAVHHAWCSTPADLGGNKLVFRLGGLSPQGVLSSDRLRRHHRACLSGGREASRQVDG